jgi:hypothetical protein
MDLEQIVKETVAKIVDEKKLTSAEKKKKEDIVMAMKKDFKGPKATMYAIATDKAKKLAEAANKIKIISKGVSEDPDSNYMEYTLMFNGDEINAEEFEKGWRVIRYDEWDDEWKDIRNPKKQEIINFINAYNEKNSDNVNEDNLNEEYDFVRSAIESASGDKISYTEEDDYGRTIYWSTKNPNVNYFVGMGGEFEGKIYLYNGETGERYPIGDLKHYGDGQNHAADDDMHEAFQPKSSFDDYSIGDNVTVAGKKAKITNMKMDDESGERRARVRFEDGTAKEVSINSLDESKELDEWTISRWQHYAGIK